MITFWTSLIGPKPRANRYHERYSLGPKTGQRIWPKNGVFRHPRRKESALRDAEARERLAQAEARATLMVSEAISKGDLQAINYFVAQKYVEALAKFANSPNQKILFLPMEASSVIGAIGGIGEITKQVFKSE